MKSRKQDANIKAMVAAMLETLVAIETIAQKHKVCATCLSMRVADMLSDGAISDAQYAAAEAEAGTVQ
jgi:hypothetical protein